MLFPNAANENLQSRLLDFEFTISETGVVSSICKSTEIRISMRCGGLLKIDHLDEDVLDEDISDEDILDNKNILARIHKQIKVRFLHHTARDFLVNTKEGQVILGQRPPPASSIPRAGDEMTSF